MSEDETAPAERLRSALGWIWDRWEWPVLAVLVLLMFLTRMRSFDAFYQEGVVFFSGTDPYYHARHVIYTVHNFPSTLGYDPLTQYPLGTDPGQFGTLFDQIGAGLAWIVGLIVDGGAPSEETVLATLVAYPAVLGALSLVPVYLLARELVPRGPAMFAAVVFAVMPGRVLFDSSAGRPDHHVIEVLLSTLALWAILRAYRAWNRSELTLEDLVEAPASLWNGAHRRALWVSLAAAGAVAAYLWAWPPGVLIVGVVGVWVLVQGTLEVARSGRQAPVVLTAVSVFLPVAILMVPRVDRAGFTALDYSWMQPTAALFVALMGAFFGALSLWGARQELPGWAYPAIVSATAVGGLGLLWLVVPQLVDNALSGLSWVTGIGVHRTRLTIAEAHPAELGEMMREFGLPFYTAAVAFFLVLVSVFRRQKPTDTLLVIWALLMTSAAFTQARFLYYLAVAVAVLNGEFAAYVLRAADYMAAPIEGGKAKGSRSSQQQAMDPGFARGVAIVLLALTLVPVHVSGFSDECRGTLNAWSRVDCFGPGEARLWHDGLLWLREHSPPTPMDLTTPADPPPPGERFDYPEGMYGVLSWWDYGHQIQLDARRPPIANPFQQQAPLASRIFTAHNETAAMDILDDYLGQGNQARYLAIDDAMVSTKFPAITIWADVHDAYQPDTQQAYVEPRSGQEIDLFTLAPEVRAWFLQDLYWNDGSGTTSWRLVHESAATSYIGNRGVLRQDGFRVHAFNDILARVGYQDARDSFGDLNYRSGDQLVPLGGDQLAYDLRLGASLKFLERVPGAMLTGSASPGTTVTATVDLEATNTGRTFTYEQTTTAGPAGTFSITVPYSTTALVPTSQGGTETDVRATGPYTVTSGEASTTVDVPDRVVLDGGTLQVALG